MVKITDENVREKIAEVEGKHWLEQDAWSEKDAGRCAEDTSVAHALKAYKDCDPLYPDPLYPNQDQDPDHTAVYGAVIYGAGGWHRYFVTHSGEVVFSKGHSGAVGVQQAEAAGFRIW